MTDTHYQIERLLEVKRTREARQLLNAAVREAPDDPENDFFAARIALQEENLEQAREHLEDVLRQQPAHVNARLFMYTLEVDAGRFSEAEQLITGLIREHPEDAELLALYAELLLRAFQLEKARLVADEALRLDPLNTTARLTDSTLLTIEGKAEMAQERIANLVADDPDSLNIEYSLFANLMAAKRHREALRLAREMLKANPDDQDLVDAIIGLRALTHPLAIPLWPTIRFGWAGSLAVWAVILAMALLWPGQGPGLAFLLGGYLAWVIYSWTYTLFMTRWLSWKGT